MSRRIAVFAVAAAVVLVTVGTPLALAAPSGVGTVAPLVSDGQAASSTDGSLAQQNASNESTGSTPPGLKLAGVIGVQGAETDGELQRRTFETKFQKANSNASKAAVVAAEFEDARERLAELEQRKERLRAQYENGSIPEGKYRVEVTRVVAEVERTKAMLNRTATAADGVPDDELEKRGVDEAELDRLRTNASELTGPEVSAIARDLAGDRPGKGLDKQTTGNESDGNETTTGSNPGNPNGAATNEGGKPDDPGERGNAPDTPPGQATDPDDAPVNATTTLSTDAETNATGTDATETTETETNATDATTTETADATTTATLTPVAPPETPEPAAPAN